jgi:hypothetical protein
MRNTPTFHVPRPLLLSAALVVCLLAFLTTSAEASVSGVTVRESEPIDVPPGDGVDQDAACPQGTFAVGGGVRWAAGSGIADNSINTLDPDFQIPEFDVEARNAGENVDSMIAIATCVPSADLPSLGSRIGFGPPLTRPITSECPGGQVAIGGGVFPDAEAAQGPGRISNLTPGGTGTVSRWSASFPGLPAEDADADIFTRVLCANESESVEAVRSGPVAQNPGALAVATAECPAGTVALGGGAEWTPGGSATNSLIASQPGPLVDGQPRSWTVIGRGAGGVVGQQFFAYAMCAKLEADAPPEPPAPDPPVAEPDPGPEPGVEAAVSFATKRKLKVTRSGAVRIGLACADGPACRGELALRGKAGKARRSLRASGAFEIAGGATGAVRAKLSRRALAQVSRAGRRGVTAEVTATLEGGGTVRRDVVLAAGRR